MTELEYVTSAIVAKVFQGDENKRNAAEHIARVAIKAGAEWYEQNFTEGIDQRYVRPDPLAPCPSCGSSPRHPEP